MRGLQFVVPTFTRGLSIMATPEKDCLTKEELGKLLRVRPTTVLDWQRSGASHRSESRPRLFGSITVKCLLL